MSSSSSFVEPGDRAEVGDGVGFHGDHGNLVRGIVADRGVSPLSNVTGFRLRRSKKTTTFQGGRSGERSLRRTRVPCKASTFDHPMRMKGSGHPQPSAAG